MTKYGESILDDIIDLTDSFTLLDHCPANFIIEIDTDDSFIEDNLTTQEVNSWSASVTQINDEQNITRPTSKQDKTSNKKRKNPTPKDQVPHIPRKKKKVETCNNFGDCPICFDKLGNNPLASTKCGHVFCMKCLQQSLSMNKKCPTCRKVLKGSTAYHPLYLDRH